MKADDFIPPPSSFLWPMALSWPCAPGTKEAARIVTFLAQAARLSPAPSPLPPDVRRLLVVVDVEQDAILSYLSYVADAVCVLEPPGVQRLRRWWMARTAALEPLTKEQWFWQQLVRLSACIGCEMHRRGGVPLHSGLALTPPPTPSPLPNLREGRGQGGWGEGILLAGPSGVGKSTASRRLPSPWPTT
jgi:hypothetical protein